MADPPAGSAGAAAAVFLDSSRRYLTTEYLPRVAGCVQRLSGEQLWWRPNAASNSVGNLLLHLEGNLRQWVISGVGGVPDVRQREAEFADPGSRTAAELLAHLAAAVAEADAVIATLDPAELLEYRPVQGREVTGLEAIYHAVEHFGMHTGQIAYATKLLTESDLGFYEVVEGIPRARWPGHARAW